MADQEFTTTEAAFLTEHSGKVMRGTLVIDDVTQVYGTANLQVRATHSSALGTYTTTMIFTESEDRVKLEKVKKGGTIVVEGRATWASGGWYPGFDGPRLVR